MVVDLPILHSAEAAYENRETPAGRELRSRLDLPALVRKTAETYRKLDCRDFYRENGRLSIDSYIDTAAKRVTGDWSGGPPGSRHLPGCPSGGLAAFRPGVVRLLGMHAETGRRRNRPGVPHPEKQLAGPLELPSGIRTRR